MEKYSGIFIVVFAVLGIVSAAVYLDKHPSPEQELDRIKVEKSECANFKSKFDVVNPANVTEVIAKQIAECKKVGAWPEVK